MKGVNYLEYYLMKVKAKKKYSLLRPVELALDSGEDLLAMFTVQWLLIIGDYSQRTLLGIELGADGFFSETVSKVTKSQQIIFNFTSANLHRTRHRSNIDKPVFVLTTHQNAGSDNNSGCEDNDGINSEGVTPAN